MNDDVTVLTAERDTLETRFTAPTGNPDAAPADPETRLATIVTAIGQLAADDVYLFTATGLPRVEAIQAVTGWPMSTAERDAAVAHLNAEAAKAAAA